MYTTEPAYTIEFIGAICGYKINTLYNLCNDLSISGVKGKVPGKPGKALYSELDMKKILLYQTLLKKNMAKAKALLEVKKTLGE
jgi:hypothetical protein